MFDSPRLKLVLRLRRSGGGLGPPPPLRPLPPSKGGLPPPNEDGGGRLPPPWRTGGLRRGGGGGWSKKFGRPDPGLKPSEEKEEEGDKLRITFWFRPPNEVGLSVSSSCRLLPLPPSRPLLPVEQLPEN